MIKGRTIKFLHLTKQEYKTGRKTESESRKNESEGGRDSESERYRSSEKNTLYSSD